MTKDGLIQVPVAPRRPLYSQIEIRVVAKHAGGPSRISRRLYSLEDRSLTESRGGLLSHLLTQ